MELNLLHWSQDSRLDIQEECQIKNGSNIRYPVRIWTQGLLTIVVEMVDILRSLIPKLTMLT